MKAILVDDEKHALTTLTYELKQNCPDIKVIGQFFNPIESIEAINNLKPDIVFLDIEMPGINGIDLVSRLEVRDLAIIYTTAYDAFALKAFKASAVDYLLKPIDPEELIAAVKKVQKLHFDDDISQKLIEAHLKNLDNPMRNRIPIPTSEGFEFIHSDDIIRCESDSNYTNIYLIGGRKIVVTKTLKDTELLFPEHAFIRIHHSHLINLNHVKKYVKTNGNYLELTDGSNIPVARRKKDGFLKNL